MFGLQVLGYIQIMQYTCCSYYAVRHADYTETFEVRRFKLLAQPLLGSRRIEHPVLELEGKEFR